MGERLTLLKALVVGLVLANVCYFLWEHGVAKAPEAVVAPPTPGTLRLASESPDAVRGESGSGAAAGAPSASTGVPAASESPRESGREGGNAGLLTNVKRCISVGPFRDVSEAAHAASTLRGGGYDPRQRVAEGEVWAGVWVYLPIPPSQSSVTLLSKLKGAGIDDALEMPGPSETSVISLGLFADQKRAQTRVTQAQALGFNPGIADRKRTGDVYWIDIDLRATDSVLKPSDLQSETGHIQRLEVKACPSAGVTP